MSSAKKENNRCSICGGLLYGVMELTNDFWCEGHDSRVNYVHVEPDSGWFESLDHILAYAKGTKNYALVKMVENTIDKGFKLSLMPVEELLLMCVERDVTPVIKNTGKNSSMIAIHHNDDICENRLGYHFTADHIDKEMIEWIRNEIVKEGDK